MSSPVGIRRFSIDKTPIAVIDFETTGLQAGPDRVVEVSVVRIEPGQRPRLVLDSLINPERRVAATEIHGITDRDVRDAPRFGEIFGPLQTALSGCVVAAYNAYFDMRFLRSEAERVGHSARVPFVCLMYLRPLLGLGERCRLEAACQAHGIGLRNAHRTATDSMAAAALVPLCLERIRGQGMRTFGDLADLGRYAFFRSFDLSPYVPPGTAGGRRLLTREDAARRPSPQSRRQFEGQPVILATPRVVTEHGVMAWLRRAISKLAD